MKFSVVSFFFVLAAAQTAYAGIPTPTSVECPIGGERFEVTGTASCSSSGRYMSMRAQSSCEFVTKIPICPSNGLPLYRDFNDEELKTLEAFIQTSEYAAMRDKSPHQVAYGVAHHLGDTMSKLGFSLALGAWWYEADAFLGNSRIQDSFLREAEGELGRVGDEDAPFVAGLTAFAMAHAGRDDFARRWLNEAQSRLGDDQYAKSYIDAVRVCLRDVNAEGCSPYVSFEP